MTENSSPEEMSQSGVRRILPGMQVVIFGDTLIGWIVRILVVAAPAIILSKSGFVLYSFVWGTAALIESVVKKPHLRLINLFLGFLFAQAVQDPFVGLLYAIATFAEWFSDTLTPPPK